MARMLFGGGPQDIYVYEDEDGDLRAGGGFNTLFFDGPDESDSPITDLLDENGNAATYITTSDGTDDRAPGQLPAFWGPNNVFEMWGSTNGSPRQLFHAANIGSFIAPTKDDVDELVNSGSTNPFNTTLSSLIGVDGPSIDAAATGTTLIKQLDGTYGAGDAPIPMSDVLWVAANDAPATFDSAPYQCDGTADNVEIQTAMNNALGLAVALSPGTFNLAARIEMYGADDVAVGRTRALIGSGAYKTKLIPTSGISAAIYLSNVVSPVIRDMEIVVAGATHAIHSSRSTTPAASNRSFQHGSIRNLKVTGPANGTHTGWVMKLGSGYRYTVENIEAAGVGNGIQVLAENDSFNPGQAVFSRCFVGIVGANGVAYHLRSDLGITNSVTFIGCHATADPAYTGTTAWKFDGASRQVRNIRTVGCSFSKFATGVFAHSLSFDLDLDFGYIEMTGTSTFSSIAGYHNRIKVGTIYLDTGTLTIMSDTNATTRDPNTYEYYAYGEAGTTFTGSLGNGVVINGIQDGGATKAPSIQQNGVAQRRTAGPWTLVGSLAGRVGAGTFRWYNDSGQYAHIRYVRISVGVAPTGAAIIVDINLSGTTIYTNQANRPTIAPGGTVSSGGNSGFAVSEIPPGGYLTVDLDQVGSTIAGSDLMVQIEVT